VQDLPHCRGRDPVPQPHQFALDGESAWGAVVGFPGSVSMAHTLNRMERDGLIRRVPDPIDGRRAIIWPAVSSTLFR
jgi:hypothetical protein